MLAKVLSVGLVGVDAVRVEVEVHASSGLPAVVVVGLPDAAVKESRDRVRSALLHSGFRYVVDQRLTVNLAPADLRKEGPAYDLPMALGILAATGQAQPFAWASLGVMGELSLDGEVRPVRGALPAAMALRDAGVEGLLLPRANAAEAALVEGLSVYAADDLRSAVGHVTGAACLPPEPVRPLEDLLASPGGAGDYAEVKGQAHAKRALSIAAAGGHNALLIGPPGSGKTMLARRLPSILPPLCLEEALEATKIHSVAGRLPAGAAVVTARPFRHPHHTISDAGLVGGGTYPRPGEISLAHHGVLFLDELPEFARRTLEVLRQPLEDGHVTIARAATSITFPAEVMLVCAMNPCPCGYFTHAEKECHCTPGQIRKYLSKVSGPLLDRIDLHVEVPALRAVDIASAAEPLSSGVLRDQVLRARAAQAERFRGSGLHANAAMSQRLIRRHCRPAPEAARLLHRAMDELNLSARAYTRVLKLSRTIADMEGSQDILEDFVAEAVQYRTLDRPLF